ncbi:MAG: hypothetical protein AAGA48_20320, partial [Myxococcota bacterium]
ADRAARAERERRQEARRARLAQRQGLGDALPHFTDELDETSGSEGRMASLGRPLAGGNNESATGLYGRRRLVQDEEGGDPPTLQRAVRSGRTGIVWPPPNRDTSPPVRNTADPSGDDLSLEEADDEWRDGHRSTAEKVDALLSRLRARRMKDST